MHTPRSMGNESRRCIPCEVGQLHPSLNHLTTLQYHIKDTLVNVIFLLYQHDFKCKHLNEYIFHESGTHKWEGFLTIAQLKSNFPNQCSVRPGNHIPTVTPHVTVNEHVRNLLLRPLQQGKHLLQGYNLIKQPF